MKPYHLFALNRHILLSTIFLYHLANVCSDGSTIEEGKPNAPGIVGGEEVEQDRYPYNVIYSKDGAFLCSGTLIAENWVLTAAHCGIFGTHVYIGRQNLGIAGTNEEIIEIVEAIPHYKYDIYTFSYDYMLLKLETPSKFSPVTLDDGYEDTDAGDDVTVMGWGKTSELGSYSPELLEVELDIVDQYDCREYYNNNIDKSMLCASRLGKDSCLGDSGGPLIRKGNKPEDDVQVGIVSWGIGCARPKYPGVYARVSQVHEWIFNQVEREVIDNDGDDFWDDDEVSSYYYYRSERYYYDYDVSSISNDSSEVGGGSIAGTGGGSDVDYHDCPYARTFLFALKSGIRKLIS